MLKSEKTKAIYKQATPAAGYQRTKMLKYWGTKTTNTEKRPARTE